MTPKTNPVTLGDLQSAWANFSTLQRQFQSQLVRTRDRTYDLLSKKGFTKTDHHSPGSINEVTREGVHVSVIAFAEVVRVDICLPFTGSIKPNFVVVDRRELTYMRSREMIFVVPGEESAAIKRVLAIAKQAKDIVANYQPVNWRVEDEKKAV